MLQHYSPNFPHLAVAPPSGGSKPKYQVFQLACHIPPSFWPPKTHYPKSSGRPKTSGFSSYNFFKITRLAVNVLRPFGRIAGFKFAPATRTFSFIKIHSHPE